MKWIIIAILIIVAILGFRACSSAGNNMMSMVETVTAERGNLEDYVSVTGMIESDEVKNYYSPVSGKLSDINVERGQTVKKGDMLISYDMDAMAKNLELARLQYVTGNSTYNGTLHNDKDTLADLQEANTNLPILEQQIKDQKAFVKSIQKSLEKMRADSANTLAAQNLNLQKQLVELQKDPIANAEKILQIQTEMETNQYISQTAGPSEEQEKLEEKLQAEQERLADYEQYKAEMDAQKKQAEASALTSYQKENLSASEQINLMNYETIPEDAACLFINGAVTDFSVDDVDKGTEYMDRGGKVVLVLGYTE